MANGCVMCGKTRFNFGDYDEGVEMRIDEMDTGEHIIVVDPPYAWSTPINYCPFCGSTNPIRFTCSTVGSNEKRYGFYCWNCKTKGPQAPSEELAAEAWNKRVQ